LKNEKDNCYPFSLSKPQVELSSSFQAIDPQICNNEARFNSAATITGLLLTHLASATMLNQREGETT
jgi:hypothetical protein